jgi:two-component system, sensor histidine kinase and response regulator
LKLIIKIDKEVPRMVNGDNKRLCQVLFSLLGNSVKYTEEGCISVNVSVLSGNSLEFVVQDTGKGMSSEEQLALFKLFGKASSSNFTNIAVGLGLTFCK